MENILCELYKQCGVSEEILKQLGDDQKMPFYRLFKAKLDMHKKNTESNIRKKYEEIKTQELGVLSKDIDNTEAMILSILDIDVGSRRRRTVTPELRDEIWSHRYGTNVTAYCRVCDVERITKFTYNNGYIIPEPKGGLTDKINIIPVCSNCFEKGSESKDNLVNILNRNKPIEESELVSLHEDIVSKYNLFNYDTTTTGISFASSPKEMMQCMCLCHSCFETMNEDYQKFLNIDIMKIIGIIKQTGELDLSSQGGNSNDVCYYLDIMLLRQYLKLMEPYKEEPAVSFNFGQKSTHNMDHINTNIIFGNNSSWFDK